MCRMFRQRSLVNTRVINRRFLELEAVLYVIHRKDYAGLIDFCVLPDEVFSYQFGDCLPRLRDRRSGLEQNDVDDRGRIDRDFERRGSRQ